MIDISVNSLVKSFEIGRNVLDGLSFSVNSGERVGILGRNGGGKTTLLRILTGEIDFDEGSFSIAAGKRIGLISQIPVYPADWTAEDVLKCAQKRIFEISAKLADLEAQLSDDQNDETSLNMLLKEYDKLQDDFRRFGGYEADSERNRIANGLEISDTMREQLFESLSGGEKTRVNLARLILEDTDILLLDEPTNHIDLNATQWLEDYISHFKGTVLTVSHDRYFLDRTVQRCIEIVDGKAEFYSGNYSFYVEERQRRFDEKMKQYEKDSAKVEQLTRAAEQMHLWAFMGMDKLHKRAFSMEKRIAKLKQSEKPTEAKKLSVKFKQADFNGNEVLDAVNLSKSFGSKLLFRDLCFEFIGGESIAVIGNNGTGKSTLLKIIMGEEPPDSGIVWIGPQVRAAYLPQNVTFEDESRSALDSMLWECRCTPQDARDRLAGFGFRGESVLTPVGAMSGGERSRLKLCMLMGSDINLLVLDEPTNFFDIASREWIEDALSEYEQTLIFVSHDRYFIDRFATRIISFDGNGEICDYKGTYKDYVAYRERFATYSAVEKQSNRISVNSNEAKAAVEKKKTSNAKSAARVEKEIGKIEVEISELNLEAEKYSSDYVHLMEIDSAVKELEEKLEALYVQWEELIS